MKRRRNPSRRSAQYSRNTRLIFLIALLIVVLLLIIIRQSQKEKREVAPSDAGVVRVIDGDTFEKADGERVRLLGIDTPEKGEPYYVEAKEFLQELLAEGELQFQYGPERTDRYGRTLAFIYSGSTFVNGEILRAGLARAYIFSDDLLLLEPGQSLCESQREALHEHRGIWSLTSPHPESRYFGNSESLRFHRPSCNSIRNSDTLDLIRALTREELLEECYSPCRNCDP